MEPASETTSQEEWTRYSSCFKKAEYAIKICEHLSAAPNIPAFSTLKESGEYAVAALQAGAERDAILNLKKATAKANQATRQALMQGLTLLIDKIENIRR